MADKAMTISKRSDARSGRKKRSAFAYDAWADYERVQAQINMPARIAEMIGSTGFLQGGKHFTEHSGVRRAMDNIHFGAQAADLAREHLAARAMADQFEHVTNLVDQIAAPPEALPFADHATSILKATEALGLQDQRPLTKALLAAAGQAGIGDHLAEANALGGHLSLGKSAAGLFCEQVGSVGFSSSLAKVTRVAEREATGLPQSATAMLTDRQVWPYSFEVPPLATPIFSDALDRHEVWNLINTVEVSGPADQSIQPMVKPVVVPAEIISTGIIEMTPEGLAEAWASADAGFNKRVAEEFLIAEGLDHALDHLDRMAEELVHGDKVSCEHAALSASTVIRILADRYWPGEKGGEWTFRWNDEVRDVEPKNTGNWLAAYLDKHQRDHLSSYEHRHLETTFNAVRDWSGSGHHVARPARQSRWAYVNLLMIIAAVARARRIELG